MDAVIGAGSELALGQNLNVGQISKTQAAAAAAAATTAVLPRLATMETAPGGMKSVLEVTSGHPAAVFHANEYLRLTSVPQIAKNLISSQHRHKAFEAMQRPPTATRNLSTAIWTLGDTSDARYPIFRRNDTTEEDTLFTVAFDMVAETATVYRDNPRHGAAAVLWSESLHAASD